MPMRFKSLKIPGLLFSCTPSAVRAVARQVHHWGSDGETEKRSRRSGRTIIVEQQLYDPTWATEKIILNFLRTRLYPMVGDHGRLVRLDHDNDVPVETFENCTFLSATPIVMPGAADIGPYPDVGRCLDSGNRQGYWQLFRLEFRQLVVT